MSESGWEYVRRSKHQSSYYRRVPWCRAHPTLAQKKVRYALGKLAHEKAFGTTGMVFDGEREIPSSANVIKKNMKGRKFASEKAPRVPQALASFKLFFDGIAAAASVRALNRDIIPLMLAEQRKKELPRLLKWQREEEKRKALSSKKKRVL